MLINAVVKPEAFVVPEFRKEIAGSIEAHGCIVVRSAMAQLTFEQILELYAEDIAQERIPAYEQLKEQFEFGKSEILEISAGTEIGELRQSLLGVLGGTGLRGAFTSLRNATFWRGLGYSSEPGQDTPAWWRYNAIHMPKDEHEQENLRLWIERHRFSLT